VPQQGLPDPPLLLTAYQKGSMAPLAENKKPVGNKCLTGLFFPLYGNTAIRASDGIQAHNQCDFGFGQLQLTGDFGDCDPAVHHGQDLIIGRLTMVGAGYRCFLKCVNGFGNRRISDGHAQFLSFLLNGSRQRGQNGIGFLGHQVHQGPMLDIMVLGPMVGH
jgi:hypothetical protein